MIDALPTGRTHTNIGVLIPGMNLSTTFSAPPTSSQPTCRRACASSRISRRSDSIFVGRDPHPKSFTIWMAGGGITPGLSLGATDEFGYNITDNPVSFHDRDATALHLMGMDHKKLTYRFQ